MAEKREENRLRGKYGQKSPIGRVFVIVIRLRRTYLEDLDSAKGTFVNGKRLTARMPVCKADKILESPGS